jgi:hypothetical protein
MIVCFMPPCYPLKSVLALMLNDPNPSPLPTASRRLFCRDSIDGKRVTGGTHVTFVTAIPVHTYCRGCMQTDATVAIGFIRAKFLTPPPLLVATATSCDTAPQGLIGLWHWPRAQ